MKCFGYKKNDRETLHEFVEVTFQATPEELRRLASFFVKCADEMETIPDWGHEHFSDHSDIGADEVDVILFANPVVKLR